MSAEKTDYPSSDNKSNPLNYLVSIVNGHHRLLGPVTGKKNIISIEICKHESLTLILYKIRDADTDRLGDSV
jgi:hypothetical protein